MSNLTNPSPLLPPQPLNLSGNGFGGLSNVPTGSNPFVSGVSSFLRGFFNHPVNTSAPAPLLPSFSGNAFAGTSLGKTASSMPTGPTLPQTPAPTPQASPLVPTANAGGFSNSNAFLANLPNPITPSGVLSPSSSPKVADLYKQVQGLVSQVQNLNVSHNLGTSGDITSDQLTSKVTPGDLLDQAAAKRDALFNGDTSSVPSNGMMDTMNNASTGYGSALQDYYKASVDSLTRNYDLRRQVQALQENGSLTKDQSQNFVNEANRQANIELADIENRKAAAAIQTDVLKPIEVSPGSSLYSPLTNSTIYQGNGAAPSTVFQTATQLAQLAQQTGNVQYNADGSINMQPYIQQAQQYYSSGNANGGQTYGGTTTGQSSQSNAQYSQDGQMVGGSSDAPQLSAYNYGVQKGLSPDLAGAVNQSAVTGDYYINGEKITSGQEQRANTMGAQKGIAFVPAANIPNIQQLDIAIGQMQNLDTLAKQYLTPGLWGRIKGLTSNQANILLQNDPGWAKFNSVRLQAIDYLKGLAQGGGFRTTQSEIDTAANSLLSTTDNLESAQAKMDTAMNNINLAYREYLPTHKDVTLNPTSSGSSNSSSSSTNGAIDWSSI